jgi:hypothetical protein
MRKDVRKFIRRLEAVGLAVEPTQGRPNGDRRRAGTAVEARDTAVARSRRVSDEDGAADSPIMASCVRASRGFPSLPASETLLIERRRFLGWPPSLRRRPLNGQTNRLYSGWQEPILVAALHEKATTGASPRRRRSEQ